MRAETDYDEALPDPVVEALSPLGDPEASAQLSDAVETALVLVLDRLSPAERVAFVLHDTFDVPFEQIGELLDRAPQAARQLASRARRRVRANSRGTDASGGPSTRRLVDAFFAAARRGDFDQLVSVLAPDVMLRVDGGASASVIVRGAVEVASRAVMFANPVAELRPVLVHAEKALRDRILAQARTLFGKDVAEHPGLERGLDFTLQFMIGAAMTTVLHEDPRLRELIEDFKALFPTVLTNATTKRRKVTK